MLWKSLFSLYVKLLNIFMYSIHLETFQPSLFLHCAFFLHQFLPTQDSFTFLGGAETSNYVHHSCFFFRCFVTDGVDQTTVTDLADLVLEATALSLGEMGEVEFHSVVSNIFKVVVEGKNVTVCKQENTVPSALLVSFLDSLYIIKYIFYLACRGLILFSEYS